jgi:excisionase family DNA binding protein
MRLIATEELAAWARGAGRASAPMTDRLLTAARWPTGSASRSSETVLRWAKRGKLPAVYLSSRAIRFDAADLEAWLDQQRTPPADDEGD